MTAALAPPGLKLGVLINPNSRKNRRHPPNPAALEELGAPTEIPADVDGIPHALQRLSAAGVEVLAVSGGDGAVLAAMTAILCDGLWPSPPMLCLIPAGTTNMTAADVGFKGGGRDPLAAAARLALSGGGRIVTRGALRLDGVADDAGEVRPRAGMFFGAIGICRAIRFCRRHIHARGVVGGPASWLTLAPLLLRNLLSDRPDGVLAGEPLGVRILDGSRDVESLSGEFAVAMASTLDRLALGSRPFWGSGPEDGIDATFVRAPPYRLARSIWPLLFGAERRPPEPHYVSRRARSVELAYSGEVTLDGELYRADAARPLRLSRAGDLRFLIG